MLVQEGKIMNVLVTGGLGYIGSHTCVELLNEGNSVVVIDNLYNSKIEVIDRIEKITDKKIKFYEADCCDKNAVKKVFDENEIDSVIHFAGYKAVGESVAKPLMYYENNLKSTFAVIEEMVSRGVKTIVFSSSATVYASHNISPLTEDMDLSATNPYGQTKLMIEQILKDVSVANEEFNPILLRYFNPIGAHESGLLGESPVGIPNNLMPYVCQVADGRREYLHVFGNDYPTVDGTGVRDYIHVVDLAKGHVKALNKLIDNKGVSIFNLGTGRGTSVLELVKAFETANNIKIPYEIESRRPGDNATVFADSSKAERELGWKAELTVEDACRSSWKFQKIMESN